MNPKQKIIEIEVENLKLWSENPRDPADVEESDLEIIKRAVRDDKKKWNLKGMVKDMGDYYDYSDLPTVVRRGNRYVVYDGNKRVALLKYIQNPEWVSDIEANLFPLGGPEHMKNLKKLPCNVCDEATALKSIERKHRNSGSWKQLERDYFEHVHLGKEKSLFLKFEEATGLISQNPSLNENIMKNNILTQPQLESVGFSFDEKDALVSVYDKETAAKILGAIVELKNDGKISSRGENKYEMRKPLVEQRGFTNKVKKFLPEKSIPVEFPRERGDLMGNKVKRTIRQKRSLVQLFGRVLFLRVGTVNDIYRDVVDLYRFYCDNKERLSSAFPNVVRMFLRLLAESAAGSSRMDAYIRTNFRTAKTSLTQDEKTTLSVHSVDSSQKLIKLLQVGAHQYSSSANVDQMVAMSVILGAMLQLTHFKKKK